MAKKIISGNSNSTPAPLSSRRNVLVPGEDQEPGDSSKKVHVAADPDQTSRQSESRHQRDQSDRLGPRERPRARDDREAPRPPPVAPPRPPRPDSPSRDALENTPDAVLVLQIWKRTCQKIAKGDTSPDLQRHLETSTKRFSELLRDADTAALSAVLETYCRSINAPRDGELTRTIVAKLKGEGVVKSLWQSRAFVKLVDDYDYNFILTRLFSYALMEQDEVGAAAEIGW